MWALIIDKFEKRLWNDTFETIEEILMWVGYYMILKN